jgi:chromosome segregation ATPase
MNKQWNRNRKFPQSNNKIDDKKQLLINSFIDKTKESNKTINIDEQQLEIKNNLVNNIEDDHNIENIINLERLIKTYKKQNKEVNVENSRLRSELKNLKKLNYELKLQNKNITDNYNQKIKEFENKVYRHKLDQRKLKAKIIELELKNKEINQIKGLWKCANNTIKQLKENNEKFKDKLKQPNELSMFINHILNENQLLKNTINSLLGELRVYKEKIEILTFSKRDRNIIPNSKKIQYGHIYKDEYSNWLFFVNPNNEYYVIENSKGLNNKIGYSVIAKIISNDYAKIL